MDYRNLYLRLFVTLFFFIIYYILFFYHSDIIIYFVTLIYLIIFLEILIFFSKLKNILIIYILFSYFFVILYFRSNFNYYEFTAIILCIACFDSSCYLFGKKFGKNKILTKISPNKTYEGLICGIFSTNFIFFLVYYNFDISKVTQNYNLFLLINIVITLSFFGDLIQSYFKRLNNLKDSSTFLPGHGGFFDRFDSFILVIIPISLINFII